MRRVRSRFLQLVSLLLSVLRRGGALGGVVGVALVAGLSLPAAAGAQACPNADIRAEQGPVVEALPDCMALELVTPPGKFGAAPNFPVFSADGDRLLFRIKAALADTPGFQEAITGDGYVAGRDDGGWVTSPTSLPAEFNANPTSTVMGMSAGLDRWLQRAQTASEFSVGIFSVQEGGLGSPWVARSPLMVPLDNALKLDISFFSFQAISADFSHLFLVPGRNQGVVDGVFTVGAGEVRYLAGDPVPVPGVDQGARNVYVLTRDDAGTPVVSLLTRDSDGKAWGGNCGAWVGGGEANNGRGGRAQGAVSLDGTKSYLSARADQPDSGACSLSNRIRILEREETQSGVEISELIESECDRLVSDPGGLCDTADGDYLFEGASLDQSKVYFTTTRQLTDTDTDTGASCDTVVTAAAGCDLYLYDADKPDGQRLTQVSAGEGAGAGSGASVTRNITSVSTDGSHAYFVAGGILTGQANSEGDTATDGQPNLYVYDATDDRIAFIATLQSECSGNLDKDCHILFGFGRSTDDRFENVIAVPMFGEEGPGGSSGGDGHILVFKSNAGLTADDVDGGHSDYFRYDADTGVLERISKANAGGSDNGPSNVKAITMFAVAGGIGPMRRMVSEDGSRIVFLADEALTTGDTDGRANPFLWREEGGSSPLTRLPADSPPGDAGSTEVPSIGVSMSLDGRSVAFQAAERLISQDGDGDSDIYVARVNGGFPAPPVVEDCDIDAGECQNGGAGRVPTESETASSSSGGDSFSVRRRLSVATVSAKARRRAARTGRLVLSVRTNQAGKVTATAKARIAKRPRRIARRTVPTGGKDAARLVLSLNRAAKRALSAGKSLRVTVRIVSPGARARVMTVRLPGVKS